MIQDLYPEHLCILVEINKIESGTLASNGNTEVSFHDVFYHNYALLYGLVDMRNV